MVEYDYALTDFIGLADVTVLAATPPTGAVLTSITIRAYTVRFSFEEGLDSSQQSQLNELVRSHVCNTQESEDFTIRHDPLLLWSEFLATQMYATAKQTTLFNGVYVSPNHVAYYDDEYDRLSYIVDGSKVLTFDFVDGEVDAIVVTEAVV